MNLLVLFINYCKPFFQNTFILKRRWPPNLHKKNTAPPKLRGRNFVYDLVEDTLAKKKPNVEVVLKSFVDGIGSKGDIVSLRPNKAYHDLLLPGLAVYKTPENVQKYSKLKEEIDVKEHSSPYAQRTINILQGITLSVVMNKDHPWVIEPWHIRASLRKCGYHVLDDAAIEMPAEKIVGPDLMKQNKIFHVTVTINKFEKVKVACRIHHWSTEPSERLPYAPEFWKDINCEPLFGDQGGEKAMEDNKQVK
jgi:large subunit ribosomal protein L9